MAAKCEDDRTALSAAFAGSSACSINDLSCGVCRYVGDEFLGVESRNSFFVENFRDNPPPDGSDDGVGAGGDIVLEVS
jgi:hypothetical protein